MGRWSRWRARQEPVAWSPPDGPADSVAAAVVRYAARLHGAAGADHHVLSPLGAWLLLALCGPLDSARDGELADAIGIDPAEAARAAALLLERPHPVVPAAAAAWLQRAVLTPRVRQWQDALPPAVERGDPPDQAGADAWANEHSLGLIDSFPVVLDPPPAAVLATAVATKVEWVEPFDVVDGAELGPASRWPSAPRQVLRTPVEDGTAHRHLIVHTAAAGLVAVHLAVAGGGLLVGSVISADPDCGPAPVLAAAHQIVMAEVARPSSSPCVSLYELPLGDGPAWTISEDEGYGAAEQYLAVLPAWSARTEISLDRDPRLGFAAAGAALNAAMEVHGPVETKQAAVARYDALGFEAAAITAMVAVGSAMPAPTRRRVATLRFGHPYAVVACAMGEGERSTPWAGLPVFSAWVAEPGEPTAPAR